MNEVRCNGMGEMPGHEGEGSYNPDYDDWLEANHDTLEKTFINDNPERFPTSESMVEIDNDIYFEEYCDLQWKIFLESKEEY